MKKVYLMLFLLVQASVVFSQHFVKGYIGGGYEQMSLNVVNADIGGLKLQAGDEIAVFDGILCCGVLTLDNEIDSAKNSPTKYIPTLLASAEDNSSGSSDYAGFRGGNSIYFRFWDSSESKEYFNVVLTFIDQTTGKPTTAKTFTNGGTFFVAASTANTDKTWTDLGSLHAWSEADSWDPAGVPEPKDNVIIPAGVTPYPAFQTTDLAYCGSLTLGSGVTMMFPSTTSGTASFIVATGIAGSATVDFRRFMPVNGWHLVSSPLSGQTVGGFLSATPNAAGIPTKDVSSRGMMDYNESTNDWNAYFTNGTTDAISAGKGYNVRRAATDGFVRFQGSLMNSDLQVAVTKENKGWNLIGNPFTSAMYVQQEVFGFIVENDAMLDISFKAIYLWDPVDSKYSVVGKEEGQANLASGQGFFIKAASAGNVKFTKQMQVNQSDVSFKSATISRPSIVLNAKANDISSSTKINFNEETTLGLDPGYDLGILRSGNGFDVYSRLVTDNGVDFMVQSLPGKSNEKYVIPVGVDATKGGEIVFSANSLNLPNGYQLMLEDKLTNSFADLKNGEMYVANLAANSKSIGRFYLHVGSSLQTGIQEIQEDKLLVYTSDYTVYIKGDVGTNAQFAVYSIDGRLVNRFGAVSQNLNQMSIKGYTPGIYFINVQSTNKYKPVKFVVGN